jgi:predicted CXXCH cytochrome family protein
VVRAGALTVIARTAGETKLYLDGKLAGAEQKAPNMLTAVVQVAAGPHVLEMTGGVKVQFTAGGKATFREHPPSAGCETCHAVKAGKWAMKSAFLGTMCFGCHMEAAFAGKHTHVPGVLADCQMCHAAHGSAAVSHLKMPKETACKLCHN